MSGLQATIRALAGENLYALTWDPKVKGRVALEACRFERLLKSTVELLPRS